MSFLKSSPGKLERMDLGELRDDDAITGPANVTYQVEYLDGSTKHQIAAKLIERYAHLIKKREGTETNGDDHDTFYAELMLAPQAAIDSGMFEIVGTEIYSKIVRSVGNLAEDTKFIFNAADSDEVDEDFTADITTARDAAGFAQLINRVEEIAVGCGSAAMFTQILGGKLNYQPIAPNQLWIVHAAEIVENGEIRPTNTLDIEEATVVVLMLDAGSSKNTYVAFFPRSDRYPKGRQVKYDATSWHKIPNVGADNASDAYDSADEVANPLTVLQDHSGDWTTPEIPVIIWIGTTKGLGTSIIPYDEALYNTCLELDLSASRALTSLNKSATGNLMFTSELGSTPIWSDNIGEGTNMLKPGQSAIMLNLPPAGGEALMHAVERIGLMLGESYGVAGYLLATNDGATVPSGAALIELNQPAAKMRRKRAEINRFNMDREFAIEKALAAIDNDDATLYSGIKQQWIVEDSSYTKTDEQKLIEAKMAMELKIKGQRELIRDHVDGMDNATDEQVDEYIAGLKLAAPKQPSLGRFAAAAGAANQ